MDTERNWGAEPWRAPAMEEDDSLILDECGRVLDKTCYRSHYFRLVKNGPFFFLLVKHGGGQERHQVGYSNRLAQALVQLDSDARYIMLHAIHSAISTTRYNTMRDTANEYRKAFAEGRLKKRKHPAKGYVKVWIEGSADELVRVAA